MTPTGALKAVALLAALSLRFPPLEAKELAMVGKVGSYELSPRWLAIDYDNYMAIMLFVLVALTSYTVLVAAISCYICRDRSPRARLLREAANVVQAGGAHDEDGAAAAPGNDELRADTGAAGERRTERLLGTPLAQLHVFTTANGSKVHLEPGCRSLIQSTSKTPKAWQFCSFCGDGRITRQHDS